MTTIPMMETRHYLTISLLARTSISTSNGSASVGLIIAVRDP